MHVLQPDMPPASSRDAPSCSHSPCLRTAPHCRSRPPTTQPQSPRPRKPRSDKGGKHDNPEARLQTSCVAWAKTQGILVDGSPGGAAFRNGAHTARGCIPGRADLIVIKRGGDGALGLAVELKIGRHDLSDAQRAWFAHAEREGMRRGVARSLAEFQRLVRDHVRPPRGDGSASDPVVCDDDDD